MEFPNLGEHCSEETCNRLDFLPLKCDACKIIFCADHISYLKHSCPNASKKDVQVPICPLCNAPVPSKRDDPPDLAVGLHIDNDCKSDYGKDCRKVFSNRCTFKGCKIKEIVRVNCVDCNKNYCLKHRHPSDHACAGKEESLRLKRLNALSKSLQNNSNGSHSNSLRNFQGTLSEDEALARALQASLQDEESRRKESVEAVPWVKQDKCRVS